MKRESESKLDDSLVDIQRDSSEKKQIEEEKKYNEVIFEQS